jgi:hypothetical protein
MWAKVQNNEACYTSNGNHRDQKKRWILIQPDLAGTLRAGEP